MLGLLKKSFFGTKMIRNSLIFQEPVFAKRGFFNSPMFTGFSTGVWPTYESE